MKHLSLCLLAALCCCSSLFAGSPEDSLVDLQVKQLKLIDSVEHAMKWQTGKVSIGSGIANLNLPAGFKFLNAEQSQYILHDIWGNPPREDVMGMLFPENGGPFADSNYAFIISFEETGYVKDGEAEDINYADMLSSIQKSEPESNKERLAGGYEAIHIVRWAQTPFYDKQHKVLHWAKEIRFGTGEDGNTLNYDIRVLGRRGILSLNAVAQMDQLENVKANINKVLVMPEFTEGNRYADFNSNTDKVAEYGIGALVAGGVLAKTGVLAAIGKFLVAGWKIIAIGAVAVVGAIKRFFTGKKNEQADMLS